MDYLHRIQSMASIRKSPFARKGYELKIWSKISHTTTPIISGGHRFDMTGRDWQPIAFDGLAHAKKSTK